MLRRPTSGPSAGEHLKWHLRRRDDVACLRAGRRPRKTTTLCIGFSACLFNCTIQCPVKGERCRPAISLEPSSHALSAPLHHHSNTNTADMHTHTDRRRQQRAGAFVREHRRATVWTTCICSGRLSGSLHRAVAQTPPQSEFEPTRPLTAVGTGSANQPAG